MHGGQGQPQTRGEIFMPTFPASAARGVRITTIYTNEIPNQNQVQVVTSTHPRTNTPHPTPISDSITALTSSSSLTSNSSEDSSPSPSSTPITTTPTTPLDIPDDHSTMATSVRLGGTRTPFFDDSPAISRSASPRVGPVEIRTNRFERDTLRPINRTSRGDLGGLEYDATRMCGLECSVNSFYSTTNWKGFDF